jgi:hypothetical protein
MNKILVMLITFTGTFASASTYQVSCSRVDSTEKGALSTEMKLVPNESNKFRLVQSEYIIPERGRPIVPVNVLEQELVCSLDVTQQAESDPSLKSATCESYGVATHPYRVRILVNPLQQPNKYEVVREYAYFVDEKGLVVEEPKSFGTFECALSESAF